MKSQAAQPKPAASVERRAATNKQRNEPPPFARIQIMAGVTLVVTFLSVMTAWSSLAPLSSAVVAPGIVGVETHRKAIQHLEGGIVERILVKDGMRVKIGDVVIELRDVAASANVKRLRGQSFELAATIARLSAERDGVDRVEFPADLIRAAETEDDARSAITTQRRVFNTRRELQSRKLGVITKKIDRLKEEISGLGEQLQAIERQLVASRQEAVDAKTLFERRLARKSRMLDADRDNARLEERQSNLVSQKAQAEQQIVELELKKTELISAGSAEVAEDLRARQARSFEVARELVAAEDILARTRLRASIDGTIVGVQVHTRGGVVQPGQTLMEIVPLSDNLIVDARVRPEDIEEVRAGLSARVVLNTLTRRFSHPLAGRLENVSADRLTDQQTGRAYYAVRVQLDRIPLPAGESKVLAGMAADVFIESGERTLLGYLAAPLVRTFNRGMREH